jgi:hypothetical protein
MLAGFLLAVYIVVNFLLLLTFNTYNALLSDQPRIYSTLQTVKQEESVRAGDNLLFINSCLKSKDCNLSKGLMRSKNTKLSDNTRAFILSSAMDSPILSPAEFYQICHLTQADNLIVGFKKKEIVSDYSCAQSYESQQQRNSEQIFQKRQQLF